MKHLLILLLALAFTGHPLRAQGSQQQKTDSRPPSSNPSVTPLDKEVDSATLSYTMKQVTAGLSIGILKKGKTYFYGYGETVKGNHQVPDEHTIFEIGSISKTFTATLLADAVNNGRLGLDDPASKYLPDSIPALEFKSYPVTLKTLSNQSSGIPRMPANFHDWDNSNPYKNYHAADLFSFYKTFKLQRQPGEKYEYSNLAVGTLGVILEKVYGKSYERLVVEKICAPLGMNDTRQFIRKEDLGEAPAGLRKSLQLTHTVTFSDGANKVGLGWHIIRPGKDDLFFHNGGTGGFCTYLAINPDKKLAVVVLSNTAISVDAIGNALMKWLETHE